MLKQIQEWYNEFMADMRALGRAVKKLATAAGIIGSLLLAFHGHVFTAVAIAGITYFFWRDKKGVDRLVGSAETK